MLVPMILWVVSSKNKGTTNPEKETDSNSSSKDDDAYYSSLAKANEDYWNNMSPEDKAKWQQWEEAESRANDPYRNGLISGGGSQTQPSGAGTAGNANAGN